MIEKLRKFDRRIGIFDWRNGEILMGGVLMEKLHFFSIDRVQTLFIELGELFKSKI